MGKDTALTIEIRAVDRATAVIRAIQAKVAAASAPTMGVVKKIGAALGSVMSRVGSVIGSVLGGVSSVIGSVFEKVALIGGAIVGLTGGAVAGLMHLIGKFDDLGDKAERLGVSVDFLAQMRYAAEQAGAPVEKLDEGLQAFSVNMGKLSANSGRFKKFLDLVSPALEEQLKKAKSNEEAFYLLAAAMDKLKDPAKRAALAAAAGLGPELAPLLAQGEAGVKKLGAEYYRFAGSQEEAAKKAGEVDESMHKLRASVDGAEAAIVSGLAPAMKIIVDQLRDWFVTHRADIAVWAKDLGEKIPGAFKKVTEGIGWAVEKLGKFLSLVGDIGGKVWDILHANDPVYNAKKAVADMTPAEAMAAAKDATEKGRAIASIRSRAFGAFSGLIGLGGSDLAEKATENVLVGGAGAVGIGPDIADNMNLNGAYQRELAKQARWQAAIGSITGARDTANAAVAGANAASTAKILVTFDNAPKGMRAKVEAGGADVDLKTGYQMIPWAQ